MASKQECDQYAVALTERFEELTRWAMENWPNREFPLLRSDFDASRREIAEIVGPKLGDCGAETKPGSNTDDPPFVDMNPAPWP
jgi:hypothetical protein